MDFISAALLQIPQLKTCLQSRTKKIRRIRIPYVSRAAASWALRPGWPLSAASALMPPNVPGRLPSRGRRAGRSRDIKHVVLLMQENRSFDHYFGTHGRRARLRRSRSDEARQWPISVSISPTKKIPTDICCRSIWTRARPTRRRFPPPATPGTSACGVEQWQNGQLAARASQGRRHQRPVCDGLLHAGGYSVSVCAGRGVYDLRRLSLLGDGPDLAEPHVLDDRHDRSRRHEAADR